MEKTTALAEIDYASLDPFQAIDLLVSINQNFPTL